MHSIYSHKNTENQGFVFKTKPRISLLNFKVNTELCLNYSTKNQPTDLLSDVINAQYYINYFVFKKPMVLKALFISLAISLGLVGCTNFERSTIDAKHQTNDSSMLIESKDTSEYGSKAATKLDNLATTAHKSKQSCGQYCDEVDAIANIQPQFQQEYNQESKSITVLKPEPNVQQVNENYEDLDSEPEVINFEDDGDDTGFDDNFDDEFEQVINEQQLGVEHVPLNAISPQTLYTFVEVIDVIRKDYVRPVNDEVLFQQAISGMLEKLDKHAEYLTPENYDHLRSFTDGEIAQVGLSVKYDIDTRYWVIDSVLSQSSAQEKGIKVGDKLLRIKKVDLAPDMTEQDIQQMLSGIAGSQVEVTVQSRLGNRRSVTLQRDLAAENELYVSVEKGVAIIRLPVFQNGSKNQLINALKKTGTPISGVVLDIRNNPGGVLSAAIDISSLFIREGDLIQVRSRTNQGQILKSNGTPYLSDLPVVILQNRYSASAAEVLASSFKSNNRATIVGEQSFGKGTVQEVVPLNSGGGLKLTVAEYRSANGELIDGVGILPDITYFHDGSDWQQKALNLLLSKDRPFSIKFDDELDGISVIDDY